MQYNKPFDQTNTAAGYVNGNPATNTAGSIPCAEGLEFPQREIVALITAAQAMGLDAPSNTDLAQMLKAVRSGLLNRFPATGTPDAIAIAPSPAYVGLVEGMRFRVKIPGVGSNTSTAPALAINSLSAPIKRRDGSAPAVGDLTSGVVVEFEIDAMLNARIASVQASDVRVTIFNALQQGLIPAIKAYNAASTWTKQPNLVWIETFGVGGGAGGGFGVSNSSTMWFGGSGGGGGYSRDWFKASDLPASVAVAIGAGGAAGNSGQTTGIAGGDTTFGSLLRARGGLGGQGVFNGAGIGGAGGPSTTDQITIGGPNGTPGYQSPAISLPTQLGLNGQGGISGAGTSNASFTPVAASPGQNGVLLVLEFYLPV